MMIMFIETYSDTVWQCVQRHFPIVILEEAVAIEDVIATKTDCSGLIAVKFTNLKKLSIVFA